MKNYDFSRTLILIHHQGVRYQLKDAEKAFKEDLAEWQETRKFQMSEEEQIKAYNEHFEVKYGGTYQEVFGNCDWDNLSSEKETDASIWSFFLQRLTDEENF